MPKKSPGRPALPPGKKAGVRISGNFTEAEAEKVDRAAALEKYEKTGTWLHDVALQKADEVIAKKKGGR
jgi:hypothetical protein